MREKHYVQFIVDHEAPEDAMKYMEERSLREIGFEYAKKYASRPRILYRYFNPAENEYVTFDQMLECPRNLRYIGRQVEITLE